MYTDQMLAAGGKSGFSIIKYEETAVTYKWGVDDMRGGITDVALSPDGSCVAFVASKAEFPELRRLAAPWTGLPPSLHEGDAPCTCNVTRSGQRRFDSSCPQIAHTAGLTVVTFSPCGNRFATGSFDKTIIVWNVDSGLGEIVLKNHTDRVTSLSFSPCGSLLASTSVDGNVVVCNSANGAEVYRNRHNPAFDLMPLDSVCFNPADKDFLATACQNFPNVVVHNISEKTFRQMNGFRFANYSPDGLSIASGSMADPRAIMIMEAASGAFRSVKGSHEDLISSATFSPNGHKLLVGDRGGKVAIFDTSTGEELQQFQAADYTSFSWGIDWVAKTNTQLAVAMGLHHRLGEFSPLLGTDDNLLKMILEQVDWE